jgi:hypothetical protein
LVQPVVALAGFADLLMELLFLLQAVRQEFELV